MSDSTIADRIREYILKHNGAATSDVNNYDQAMNVDTSSDTVKGMADGGEVEAPTAFDADQTEESNDADNEKVISSHPGNKPQDLDKYIQGQESQADKFGPDQQKAVMDSILQEQRSPVTQIGRGMTGMADAIMQGVARAGNPGFQQQYDQNLMNRQKMQADAVPQLQKMNMEQMAAKQGLEAQRPGSAINQSATPVLSATLTAMGIPKDQLAKFLSNPAEARRAIDTLKEVIPAKDKVKIENELKMMELHLQEKNAEATHALTQQERDISAKRAQDETDKAVLGGSSIPFIGPSHAQKQAALARLSSAGGNASIAPDVAAYAQKHGITPEQAQAIKDKRTGGQ